MVIIYPMVSSTSWQLPPLPGSMGTQFEKQFHIELQTRQQIPATLSPFLLSSLPKRLVTFIPYSLWPTLREHYREIFTCYTVETMDSS